MGGMIWGAEPTLPSAVGTTPDWAMDCFVAFLDIAQTEPHLTLFMAIRTVYLVLLSPYVP